MMMKIIKNVIKLFIALLVVFVIGYFVYVGGNV